MNTSDLHLNEIDELGSLVEQIAAMTKRADAIKKELKELATSTTDANKEFFGDAYKAVMIEANRQTVDYASLLEELGASKFIIAKHTKTTAIFSIKTSAIAKVAKAA